MKRSISLLTVLTLAATLPIQTVNAAENPDLKALAESLGFESDHFSFGNFSRTEDTLPVNYDYFDEYYNSLENLTKVRAEDAYKRSNETGAAFGLCTLEMLSHNGVISPSDIFPEADKLSDIEYCDAVDKYISLYEAAQERFAIREYYRYLLYRTSTGEQADRLIEIAERSMAEGRYFLMISRLSMDDENDNAPLMIVTVGSGIAEGEWEFDGKKYDKCVLTSDPNSRYTDSETIPNPRKPFEERLCVFINSETKDVTIPDYAKHGFNDLKIASIDNDSLLNYNGFINPSTEIEGEDMSMYNCISDTTKYGMKYEGEIIDNNGVGEPFEFGPGAVIGKKFRIKSIRDFIPESYILKNVALPSDIYIIGVYGQFHLLSSKETVFDFDTEDNKAVFTSDGEFVFRGEYTFNEGYYKSNPYCDWGIEGNAVNQASIDFRDNGAVISSDSPIKDCLVSVQSFYFTDPDPKYDMLHFNSDNEVMISLNEEEKLNLSIDPDNDGIFDTPVQKGDFNSDGIIDGRDATAILTQYAKDSVQTGPLSSFWFYGDYNNDGILDARDASDVLTYYAKSSVEK